MSGTGRGRVLLGGLGVAAMAYGAWLLLSRQAAAGNLDVLLWLAGGVLAHDLLLAPAALLVGWGVRMLPALVRPAAAAGLVVLGTLTLLAVPFLGGFGRAADPANTTVLDRDYTTGFLVLVVVVLVLVVLPVLVLTARRRRA